MKRLSRLARAVLGTVVLSLLIPSLAGAAIIRFDQVNQGGTVTGTNPGPFVGTDIVFEFITYDDGVNPIQTVFCGTPTFSGVALTGTDEKCYLNFDTATNTFEVTVAGLLIDDSGVNTIAGTSGVLLSGTFNTFEVDATGLQFSATGIDTKNEALLEFFGIDPSLNFSFNNTEIRTLSDGTVTQADLVNTAVPEPGIIALFGLGLLAAGRRMVRSRA